MFKTALPCIRRWASHSGHGVRACYARPARTEAIKLADPRTVWLFTAPVQNNVLRHKHTPQNRTALLQLSLDRNAAHCRQ